MLDGGRLLESPLSVMAREGARMMLKVALEEEMPEAAWATLYSTKSRAFDTPKAGKIAVKVINHYGDEVLKVFEIFA